jgi:polysaccharide pyruvyl transferase CsaB
MRHRVVFSGYYGFGNAGDEAVLAASAGLLRDRRPDLAPCALSADPAATRAAHGIDAVPRMRFAAVKAAAKESALFLSGGGSLLQDRTSLRSLLYYLFVLNFGWRAGARTMVFAQGIGPLVRPAARRMVAEFLKTRVHAITVRDAESAALLRELGIGNDKGPEVEVTADPVFALAPRATDRVGALSAARPALAVSLRPWKGVEALLEPLAGGLTSLSGRVALQAWALQPHEDLPLCEALAARVPGMEVVREPLSPGEWAALAARKDLVLGMRLHALIFAASRAVPVLGVSYDPKVDALLERLGAGHLARVPLNGEALDPGAVREAVAAALAADSRLAEQRRERAAELRRLAARNVDRALELL